MKGVGRANAVNVSCRVSYKEGSAQGQIIDYCMLSMLGLLMIWDFQRQGVDGREIGENCTQRADVGTESLLNLVCCGWVTGLVGWKGDGVKPVLLLEEVVMPLVKCINAQNTWRPSLKPSIHDLITHYGISTLTTTLYLMVLKYLRISRGKVLIFLLLLGYPPVNNRPLGFIIACCNQSSFIVSAPLRSTYSRDTMLTKSLHSTGPTIQPPNLHDILHPFTILMFCVSITQRSHYFSYICFGQCGLHPRVPKTETWTPMRTVQRHVCMKNDN